eukprot:Blabericola_migrator_1__3142@NODE_1919_length_3561_cov_127_556096_g1206_i1_p1_GENE_NODE_1919_length_3561_cov_127_556096_g1206_i1NODE_1919_length_3561_cov_127_556096_g1206_i1_p1_ORF_typecomplete_len395_score40_43_NODE_1919_length_3561_cov_127_556096_g1206_i110982282
MSHQGPARCRCVTLSTLERFLQASNVEVSYTPALSVQKEASIGKANIDESAKFRTTLASNAGRAALTEGASSVSIRCMRSSKIRSISARQSCIVSSHTQSVSLALQTSLSTYTRRYWSNERRGSRSCRRDKQISEKSNRNYANRCWASGNGSRCIVELLVFISSQKMKAMGLAGLTVIPPSVYDPPDHGQYQRLTQAPMFHFTFEKQREPDTPPELPPALNVTSLLEDDLQIIQDNINVIQERRRRLRKAFEEVADFGSRRLDRVLDDGVTGYGNSPSELVESLTEKAKAALPPLMITDGFGNPVRTQQRLAQNLRIPLPETPHSERLMKISDYSSIAQTVKDASPEPDWPHLSYGDLAHLYGPLASVKAELKHQFTPYVPERLTDHVEQFKAR